MLDTLILSWLISGDLFVGVKISSVEILTKMILYYIHERVWFKSSVKIVKNVIFIKHLAGDFWVLQYSFNRLVNFWRSINWITDRIC